MTQIYKIGTQTEFEALQEELETALAQYTNAEAGVTAILNKIKTGTQILDTLYGADRNWQEEGGYVALFIEPIEDNSKELKELLKEYNQDVDCLELSDGIATAITEKGVVDWFSEIYLIGTEYAIQIVRPRLRERFDEHTPRYISRDINTYLPPLFHVFLERSIEKMRKKVKLDYLQVFELEVEKQDEMITLKITHKQEVPQCRQQLYWDISSIDGVLDNADKWNGKKIFMMDDDIAVTTLFPYER